MENDVGLIDRNGSLVAFADHFVNALKMGFKSADIISDIKENMISLFLYYKDFDLKIAMPFPIIQHSIEPLLFGFIKSSLSFYEFHIESNISESVQFNKDTDKLNNDSSDALYDVENNALEFDDVNKINIKKKKFGGVDILRGR